jgi:hypothetical protein
MLNGEMTASVFSNCHLHFLHPVLSILNAISLADNLLNTPFSGGVTALWMGKANSTGETGKIMVKVGQSRYSAGRRWRSSL